MTPEVKINLIWGIVVAVIAVSLFSLIGFAMVSADDARQVKFEQCIQNNGQWISESCVK